MNTQEESKSKMKKDKYTKFALMLGASFVAMYVTMYLNTYEIDHVYFSLTRFYMSCLGIAAMALIMFFFMRGYVSKQKEEHSHRCRKLAFVFYFSGFGAGTSTDYR